MRSSWLVISGLVFIALAPVKSWAQLTGAPPPLTGGPSPPAGMPPPAPPAAAPTLPFDPETNISLQPAIPAPLPPLQPTPLPPPFSGLPRADYYLTTPNTPLPTLGPQTAAPLPTVVQK